MKLCSYLIAGQQGVHIGSNPVHADSSENHKFCEKFRFLLLTQRRLSSMGGKAKQGTGGWDQQLVLRQSPVLAPASQDRGL